MRNALQGYMTKRHDSRRAMLSLFTDNRQNLLRRALCACASAEALGDFGGFFTIGGVGKHFVNRFPDGCGFRLVELHACAKLKHARAHAALLRRLRKHDQRHAEIQGFAGAVHAAMGEKHVGDLQHGDLIHMRVDFDVAGQRAQRGGLHLFADGEDDAAGAVRQCGDALLVKRKLIVDNRAQRDVDKRLRGLLHTHSAGRMDGPTKA